MVSLKKLELREPGVGLAKTVVFVNVCNAPLLVCPIKSEALELCRRVIQIPSVVGKACSLGREALRHKEKATASETTHPEQQGFA